MDFVPIGRAVMPRNDAAKPRRFLLVSLGLSIPAEFPDYPSHLNHQRGRWPVFTELEDLEDCEGVAGHLRTRCYNPVTQIKINKLS